jgi:hypothetical protein
MLNPAQIGRPALPKPLAGLSPNRTGPLLALATHHSPLPFLISSRQLLEFNASY